MIPKTFNLVGCKWKVKKVKDLSELGRCDPATFTIYIKDGLLPAYEEQTFYHELVHSIMFAMGKSDHNEEFVEAFGALLHQFTRSQK